MSKRQVLFLLGVLCILIAAAKFAHAAPALLGGVGRLMGPGSGTSVPGGGFAIITEGGDPIVTEDSSVIVTEDAP